MAVNRPESLARFLDAARMVVSARVEPGTPPGDAAARIFGSLGSATGSIARGRFAPLPANRYLPAALERARAMPEVSPLAEAFETLEPELRWRRRPGSEARGATFHHGHANADVIGPGGLERRGDVWVGATLTAPNLRYVDHQHPPEEIYIVMSEGDWFREDRGWHTPGAGGIVYNPPDIVHAMRAGSDPLLAFWFLWAG